MRGETIMVNLNKFRSLSLAVFAGFMALVAVGASLVLAPKADAQNAGQFQFTVVGNELIQIYPPNTASVVYTSVASLRDGRMYLYNVPLTGFSIPLTVDQSTLSLNPAGTLAAGTVTMPPTAVDGKTMSIYSTQTITALTLSTSNSATFTPAAPTTLAANAHYQFVYSKAANTWYRVE